MGSGYAITNEEDFDKPDEELECEEQSIGPDVPAIKGLGQFNRFKAANAFRQLIENLVEAEDDESFPILTATCDDFPMPRLACFCSSRRQQFNNVR